MENTGTYHYTTLIEIDILTGAPTGNVKPNLPTDPDYIAPITDLIACPLPTTTTTTLPGTTTTTTEFVEQLILTDVLLIIGQTYNLFFESNFALNQLYSQISVDGVNWSLPFLLNDITSPESRVISLGGGSFYVRIYNVDLSSNIVYSNVFHFN